MCFVCVDEWRIRGRVWIPSPINFHIPFFSMAQRPYYKNWYYFSVVKYQLVTRTVRVRFPRSQQVSDQTATVLVKPTWLKGMLNQPLLSQQPNTNYPITTRRKNKEIVVVCPRWGVIKVIVFIEMRHYKIPRV